MENTVSFTDVIPIYNRLSKTADPKLQLYQFSGTLIYAYPENIDLLERFGIELSKGSQWIVLTIEPQQLEKNLRRAQDLGFMAAYQQNPVFLRADVDTIIKRMSICDAYNIKYIDDAGKYQRWLFQNRGYDYVISEFNRKNGNIISLHPEQDNKPDNSVELPVEEGLGRGGK